jgi:hypothetical protein
MDGLEQSLIYSSAGEEGEWGHTVREEGAEEQRGRREMGERGSKKRGQTVGWVL